MESREKKECEQINNLFIIIIKKKSKIVTKYKEVKLTNFLRVKYKYQLIVRLKIIKNIMRFFYLFIFCTFYS